jgi:hypothetical protein
MVEDPRKFHKKKTQNNDVAHAGAWTSVAGPTPQVVGNLILLPGIMADML